MERGFSFSSVSSISTTFGFVDVGMRIFNFSSSSAISLNKVARSKLPSSIAKKRFIMMILPKKINEMK